MRGVALPRRRPGRLQPKDRWVGDDEHMRTKLVADALQMAVARRRPERGLIHHSDQGSPPAKGRTRRPTPRGSGARDENR
jgi:transposase InsO family protein